MILRILALFLCIFAAGSATADQLSIHAMVVDKKALELSENRQITFGPEQVIAASISPDGKRMAYISIKQNTINLCIARTNGTSATAVISSPYYTSTNKRPDEGESWQFKRDITWSPNSKHIAIPATKNTWNPTTNTEQNYVLILASNGAHEATLIAPQPYNRVLSPIFSPTSNKLATIADDNPQEELENAVVIYDIPQSAGQVIFSQPDTAVELGKWDSDGQSIRAVVYDNKGIHYQRIWLNGQPSDVLQERYNSRPVSYDDTLRISHDKSGGIAVENLQTGNLATVVNEAGANALSWVPNNLMFLYQKQEKISEKAYNRNRRLNTLWLANIQSTNMNTMCLALDFDGSPPTWSTDCTKMAYICNERLYIAELNWRELSAREKVTAGIATEEEERALLLENAKQLGIGFEQYLLGSKSMLPDETKAMEAIGPFVNNEVFYKPGTDQIIFKYISPGVTKFSEIENQDDTIICELDLGRSWKVVLSANGHARVVDK